MKFLQKYFIGQENLQFSDMIHPPPPLNFKFAREKLLQTDGGTCRVIITYQKAF